MAVHACMVNHRSFDVTLTDDAGEVLIMERGRALSFDEEMQYGGGMNDVYQLDDDTDGEEPLKQVLGGEVQQTLW